MHYQQFWLPKRGNSAAEYEDAFAGDANLGRFAIADGATESSFAGSWAKLLTDAFVQAPAQRPGEWASWLPPLQERWRQEVGDKPLPWYAETKLEQGAFATFLGVVIEKPSWPWGPRWRAVAVGDSCLFHLRDAALHKAFPLTQSAEFGTSPWLVGSRTSLEQQLDPQKLKHGKGSWQPNDRLWLMTDALAAWFLRQLEEGKKPWETIDPWLGTDAADTAFAPWIEELRNSQQMRNDDVTFLTIQL